jgi:phosphate transport system permease protein
VELSVISSTLRAMSTTISAAERQRRGSSARARDRRRSVDRFGDGLLYGVCAFAALLGLVLILLIGYQVVHGAVPAISKFGLGFLVHTTWQPNFGVFGAGSLL